jgi:uncharacterized protein (TIGR02147 family)
MRSEIEIVESLKSLFSARCARNPRYSLRSFSKNLNVSHSLLSLVLNGKRAPSRAFENRVLKLMKSEDQPVEIGIQSFEQIASWIHYAILGLVRLPGFQHDAQWIATKLSISKTQASLALDTLGEHGYLKKINNRWRQAVPPFRVGNKASSSATRRFTREVLSVADHCLDSEPFEAREFGSMFMAIREEDVPYAREKMREFRKELSDELEAKGTPDRVYALTCQLFPLSQK